jgi:hypothetical protein
MSMCRCFGCPVCQFVVASLASDYDVAFELHFSEHNLDMPQISQHLAMVACVRFACSIASLPCEARGLLSTTLACVSSWTQEQGVTQCPLCLLHWHKQCCAAVRQKVSAHIIASISRDVAAKGFSMRTLHNVSPFRGESGICQICQALFPE